MGRGDTMKKVTFADKQPEYRYFLLADDNADVFVYDYIGEAEEVSENGNKVTVYEYNVNEFRVSQNIVTEEMVKANPAEYLRYKPVSPPSDHERLETIEQAFMEFVSEVL